MEGLYDLNSRVSAVLTDHSSEKSTAALSPPAIAVRKFNELSEILGRGLSNQIVPESLERSNELQNQETPTRNSYLPRIVLIRSDALALELPSFADEPQDCVAFGNVSTENFIDLFWESVRAVKLENASHNEAHSQLEVYEVSPLLGPRILLSYKNQLFCLTYVRYDNLVREYPDILSTPEEFFDGEDDHAQGLVKRLQAGIKVRERLDHSPEIRDAYSYIKRWTLVRGLTKLLSDQTIFQLVVKYQSDVVLSDKKEHPSPARLIREFFMKDVQNFDRQIILPRPKDSEPCGFESYGMEDWEKMLEVLDQLHFHDKMANYQDFLRVFVTYAGPSRLKGGEWISMVERRIGKMEERLQRASKGSIIRMWPQRLARPASAKDTVYEGYYVVGISSTQGAREDIETARTLGEKLEQQVMEDRLTPQFSCSIQVLCEEKPQVIEGQRDDLRPCTTKWPRKTLTGDETSNTRQKRDGIMPEKHKKKAEKSAVDDLAGPAGHEKAERFRTAAEVYNRLKFDDAYDIDEFVLGYIDRHNDKILEKEAVNWVRETTAEEFIPEHRIEYFRRTNVGGSQVGEDFYWHKSRRLDRIFQ